MQGFGLTRDVSSNRLIVQVVLETSVKNVSFCIQKSLIIDPTFFVATVVVFLQVAKFSVCM